MSRVLRWSLGILVLLALAPFAAEAGALVVESARGLVGYVAVGALGVAIAGAL